MSDTLLAVQGHCPTEYAVDWVCVYDKHPQCYVDETNLAHWNLKALFRYFLNCSLLMCAC